MGFVQVFPSSLPNDIEINTYNPNMKTWNPGWHITAHHNFYALLHFSDLTSHRKFLSGKTLHVTEPTVKFSLFLFFFTEILMMNIGNSNLECEKWQFQNEIKIFWWKHQDILVIEKILISFFFSKFLLL